MLQPAHQELEQFLRRWRPTVGDSNYPHFVEGVRRVVVSTQVRFRDQQKGGGFTDKTGDAFLQECVESFEDSKSFFSVAITLTDEDGDTEAVDLRLGDATTEFFIEHVLNYGGLLPDEEEGDNDG